MRPVVLFLLLALTFTCVAGCDDDEYPSQRSRIISMLLENNALSTALLEKNGNGSDVVVTLTTTNGASVSIYDQYWSVNIDHIGVTNGFVGTNYFVLDTIVWSNYAPIIIAVTNFSPALTNRFTNSFWNTNSLPIVPTNRFITNTFPIQIFPTNLTPTPIYPTNPIIGLPINPVVP